MTAYLLFAIASALIFGTGYCAGRRTVRPRPQGRHRHDPGQSSQMHVTQLLASAMVL
ncbi:MULTISPECIES: hypothetical protein [unclassified Nocardia]|uniref:hypothetical protein n=1 Tax=unclassified Nocardia TaxID=2637762 RepID=UPI0024A9D1E5|nr:MULTISPECIES: hypothetical protein [unclassified Nocardia]